MCQNGDQTSNRQFHQAHVQRLGFNSHTDVKRSAFIERPGVNLFVWHVESSRPRHCAPQLWRHLLGSLVALKRRKCCGGGERYSFPSLSDDADISMGRKTDVTQFQTTWCMCQKAIIQLFCHPAPRRMGAAGEIDKSSHSESIPQRLYANGGWGPKTY